MSAVFVLDTDKQPRSPVHAGYARLLLQAGKAAVWRRYPFTIILKDSVKEPVTEPLRLKLDPGSKTTGLAVVNEITGEIVFAAELAHRGHKISASLAARRAVRRSRRSRHTRYRQPRFSNRGNQQKGWLPPSLQSRISNVLTWATRIMGLCPVRAISLEGVKFDMQAMDNPEMTGIGYQQGTLAGYEVREYLLEKWGRKCAYCGVSNVALQIEHIHPRSRGGGDRVCNLTLACDSCNKQKGTQDIRTFLKHKPDVGDRILAQAKAPLKDAAAVNATRWALYQRLQALDVPIESGSGGLTKYNRKMRGLSKAHWIDAACVGQSTPLALRVEGVVPLLIRAQGHGCRQVRNADRFGFPKGKPKKGGRINGFKTGDLVRADVAQGQKVGTYTGRVLVRASGSFDIQTKTGRVQGINSRYCCVLHRSEGYSYQKGEGYAAQTAAPAT